MNLLFFAYSIMHILGTICDFSLNENKGHLFTCCCLTRSSLIDPAEAPPGRYLSSVLCLEGKPVNTVVCGLFPDLPTSSGALVLEMDLKETWCYISLSRNASKKKYSRIKYQGQLIDKELSEIIKEFFKIKRE